MKHKKQFLIILSGLILIILLTFFFGKDLLCYIQDPQKFQIWIDQFGIFGQLMMIALIFLQIVIAWLPGEVLEVGAGVAFGFWEGSFLVLFGSMLASTFVILVVKRFGKKVVYHFFPEEKIQALSFLHDQKRLDRFIFIAFLIPGSPKDILTYAVGLSDMKVSHFILLSTIGRIPSVITSTFTGSALGIANWEVALLSFGFTLLISAVGLLAYNQISKRQAIS